MTAVEDDQVTVALPALNHHRGDGVLVSCSLCGTGYFVAERTERWMRQNSKTPTCTHCRRPGNRPIDQVTDRHRRWAATVLSQMNEFDRMIVGLGLGAADVPMAAGSSLALAASASRR